MYFHSKMEQKSYIVSKRSVPSDSAPARLASSEVQGTHHLTTVHDQFRIRDRPGQRYDGTTRTGAKGQFSQ
jgi:hypothetical protein